MKQELLIGITESGVMHTDAVPPIPLDTKFQIVPDYGGGAKYSIFENSLACAQWLREAWNTISTQ